MTKTGVPWQAEVPPQSAAFLRAYLADSRPLLAVGAKEMTCTCGSTGAARASLRLHQSADRECHAPGNRCAGTAAFLPRCRGYHASPYLAAGCAADPLGARAQRLRDGRTALHSGEDHRGRAGLWGVDRSPEGETTIDRNRRDLSEVPGDALAISEITQRSTWRTELPFALARADSYPRFAATAKSCGQVTETHRIGGTT